MASSSSVSTVYTSVIDDVLSKVRKEFINHGVGDAVLHELQALWETRLLHCGALTTTDRARASSSGGDAAAAEATPPGGHDLNAPYDEEYYATPTADMLFPPTPLQTPIRSPLPSPISGMTNGVAAEEAEPKFGLPSPYMASPLTWMVKQRPLGGDVDVAYEKSLQDPRTRDFLMMYSGKRKRGDEFPGHQSSGSVLPQQDGSADQTVEFVVSEGNAQELWKSTMNKQRESPAKTSSIKETTAPAAIPQLDGVQEDDYNYQYFFPGASVEDYNNTPADSWEYPTLTLDVATSNPENSTGDGDDDDDEPPLNEDDDDVDELDDFEQGDEDPNTQNLVLSQFDNVGRTKNRWRCTLRSGIMHLNGREILFNKGAGEFDF